MTKDSWKLKVPNSEESDSRSQTSQSPDSLTSFSLRLSDDEEEDENIVKDTPPPMKKMKIDDLCNGEESNTFKGVYISL